MDLDDIEGLLDQDRRTPPSVIMVDANLLLHAFDSESPVHERARMWLKHTLASEDEVGLALMSLLAFLRVGTHPSIFRQPLSATAAFEIASGWLDRPNVGVVQPTREHLGLVAQLARTGKARGPLLMDAHLAALAIEHGATLCTTDRDLRASKAYASRIRSAPGSATFQELS